MSRKWMAWMLALIMVLSTLAGCGDGLDGKKTDAPETTQADTGAEDDKQSTEETGQTTEAPKVEITYPLENAGSLTMWLKDGYGLHGDYLEFSESPFHTGLSERTGVDIVWQRPVVGASEQAAYNLMLQEDPLPNIIYGVTVEEITDLYDQDLIWDLTEYLPEYAPDYWEAINSDETWFNEIADIEGRILKFSMIRDEANSYYQGMIIRQDWLDECGLEMPVTLEELENVLIKFKEKYGAYLCGQKKGIFFNLSGLASGTDAMGGIGVEFYIDDDGKVQCAQVQDEWKELITTLNRWHDMDLIDPDFTTTNNKACQAKMAAGEVGVAIMNISKISAAVSAAKDTGANWVPLGNMRTAEGAPTKNVFYSAPINEKGGVITKSCSEEQLIVALKLLNYGYTEAGTMYYNYGTENETYYIDDQGEIQLTDLVLNDPAGAANALKKYSAMTGTAAGYQTARHVELRNDEVSIACMKVWAENTVFKDYRLPVLDYTNDETNERSDKLTTIETYAEPIQLKFLMGEVSLETWDEYVSEMYKLGLQDVIDIIQTAYDREYRD